MNIAPFQTVQPLGWTDSLEHLQINSTLTDLSLYECTISADILGKEVEALLEASPLLPGVILMENQLLVGVISRQRFFKQMSKRYGVDLFLNRPISEMFDYARVPVMCFQEDTPIVTAAYESLQRPPNLLYEPILVEVCLPLKEEMASTIDPSTNLAIVGLEKRAYYLLDVHQLLIADAQIHKLTKQLLEAQTKAQMLQTEKMASLGRSISGIAHEIRNPVNSINGNIEFLETYFNDLLYLISTYEEAFTTKNQIENQAGNLSENSTQPNASDDLIDLITVVKQDIEYTFMQRDLPAILNTLKVSSSRLVEIVNSLRSFSRVGDGKPKIFNVHECLDSSLLILNSRLKKIKLQKSYAKTQLEVMGYSGQISQVFINLIVNALDAIELSEQTIDNPMITLSTEILDEEWVTIKVLDNGPGIPEAVCPHIFENFYTTKPDGVGTGMGLAIVHEIITKNHHGRILFRSDTSWGTEFEIRLPICLSPTSEFKFE